MKQKIAWLALVLGALIFCLKWRLDHPTPTKLDRETRRLFLKPYVANINYIPYSRPPRRGNPSVYVWPLSQEESKVFAECLFLLPPKTQPSPVVMGKNGMARLSWLFTSPDKEGVERMTVFINPGESDNKLVVDYKKWQVEYKLHPVTAKRWISLLLAHPRFGPELRARMKS